MGWFGRNKHGDLNICIEKGGSATVRITNTITGDPIVEILSIEIPADGRVGAAPFTQHPFTPGTTGQLSIATNGTINWGPGGNSGTDTNLFRSSSNNLKTSSNMIIGGNHTVSGNQTISGTTTMNNDATVNGNVSTSTLSVGGNSLHMSQGSPSPGPPGGGPGSYTPSYESQMSACLANLITRLNNAGVL